MADRAIAENPRDYRPWTAKGAAFSDQGKVVESRIAWGRAKALEPDNEGLADETKGITKEIFGRLLGRK